MLRRSFLKAGSAVVGFGQAKTQGFSNPVLQNFAAGNVRLSKSGFIVYSGPPAANNVFYSVAPAQFTDKYGNVILQGETDYYKSGAVYWAQNTLNNSVIYYSSNTQNAWGFQGSYEMNQTVANDFTVFPPASGGASSAGLSGAGFLELINSAGQVVIFGPPDTWHSLGVAGATGCTLLQARYTLSSDNLYCIIDIALEAGAGGSTAGTYTWTNTLPYNYQFVGNYLRNYPLPFNANIVTATQDSVIVVDGNGTANPGRVRMTIPAVAANVFFTGTCQIPLT